MENTKIKKINLKSLIGYVALLFVCLSLANAKVCGISPFLFAFLFACIFVGVNEKVMAGFCLASAVVVDLSLESFLIALTSVAVCLINYYIHRLIKRKINLATNICVYLLSLCTYIYYNFHNVWNLCAYLVLGLISLWVFTCVCQVMILRRNCFKLTLDETICFLFAIAVLGLGVATVDIFGFEVYKLVLMLTIFVSVSVGNATLTFALTLAFGSGVAIGLNSLLPIAEFAIISLLCGMFSMPNKVKICISALLGASFVEL